MRQKLGTVTLKTHEEMHVYCITAPAEEYTDTLCHFLEHKGTVYFRDIKQRLLGNYASLCIDKYFVGEIDGQIAGQIYYGYPIDGTGIGNFGHVYTEPIHRKKGVTNALMPFVMNDFDKSPARALLCSTGTPWVARFYLGYGFQPVIPGADCGPLALLKNTDKSFDDFAQEHFTPGAKIIVSCGTMKECFDADKMLAFDMERRGIKWLRVGMASCVNDYRNAVFMMEDGKGVIVVAISQTGTMVGWGFFLNTGSVYEKDSKIFDFVIHPNYECQAGEFVRGALKLATEKNIKISFAHCVGTEKKKIDLLATFGFRAVAHIDNYCTVDGKKCNLVILRHDTDANCSQ